MLIDANRVKELFVKYNIQVKGILHVGAHECEEKESYNKVWNVQDKNILWVDANKDLVEKNIRRGIPNCYTAALDDSERTITFHITNNGQSSSLLELGTHKTSYPHIVVSEERKVRTQTLAQFFERNMLDISNYNVWNFDIQGSEYNVFHGSQHLLKYADVIYTEINTADVYKGCGLLKDLDELLGNHGLVRVETEMTPQSWGDAVYIRKKILKKMKILQYPNDCHVKNAQSMKEMCAIWNIEFEPTNDRNRINTIDYDILWLPMFWISPDELPQNIKIMYGPHHFVFPEGAICGPPNEEWSKRCVYNCLSDWVKDLYKEFTKDSVIPFHPLPFGINPNIEDVKQHTKTIDCIIYYKRRNPEYLEYCKRILDEKKMTYKVFSYQFVHGRYSNEDFMNTLKYAKCVIWIGTHEAQGFAFQECMASNVPILVWDATTMFDEVGEYDRFKGQKNLFSTTATIWSEECGEKITNKDELSGTLDKLLNNLSYYNPRKVILWNNSTVRAMANILNYFKLI